MKSLLFILLVMFEVVSQDLYSKDIILSVYYKCCEKGKPELLKHGLLKKDSLEFHIEKSGITVLPDTGTYLLRIYDVNAKEVFYSVVADSSENDCVIISQKVTQYLFIPNKIKCFKGKDWPWACENGHLYNGFLTRYYWNGNFKFMGEFKKGKAVYVYEFNENGTLSYRAEYDKYGIPYKQIWYDENGKVIDAR